LVGFAFFLISAFWTAYDALVPIILNNHFGLLQWVSGAVMSLDNVIAVVLLPIFGAVSDKINSKYGKRTPFVFVGTIAAVIVFIILSFVDLSQVKLVMDEGLHDMYAEAASIRDAADALLKEGKRSGDAVKVALANEQLAVAEAMFEEVRLAVFDITKANIGKLIAFIGVLLAVLLAMATFRSPAVALMPDVTVKPLRSKGNAIINLMGTAGGILVLVFGMLFGTGKIYMNYTGYVFAVAAIMLVGLGIFIVTVKEKKWADEMAEDTKRLKIEEESTASASETKKLSRAELTSLILILASVALWYIGYNSITSKYSVYATNILGLDHNSTLVIAQAAAVIAYIPVGIVASKIGRRKSILAGIVMLASAFFVGNFITSGASPVLMYLIFSLAGIGWATINVNSFPMVVELARGGEVGKYTGYYYTASMAAQIVAPILSGALYDMFGMRAMFFSFGTVFVALSFVTMFFVKHGDAKAESKGMLESLAGADD
jgi:MFS family permease